ncbi:helix-turn-helix domain-containing protein [Oscillibacter sp.]|uniref:IclR family transcriptional regulator n=1 Tax=Oscillibacter sp. TaxID=1945593 RepID=UPI0026174FAD|nr:helix-turn-helix domain-containing protein [Oscillibacter sp.]MDD3347676.1 helix-turn-helix domain-containing protein [Oscillibacter sp.]
MAQVSHRSTSRVLDIFDLLSTTTEGFTLTEIAQALESPKSSLLPILQTMAARSYIDLDYHTNRYTIGINLFYASSIYRNKISMNKFIDMEMRQLTHRMEESCCLGTLEEDHVLFLHRTDPPDSVCCYKSPGRTELACLGAIGKCLLCDFKLSELTELFFKDGGQLPPQLNLYRAHIQMEETRLTNIAYEYGEVEPGIQCVAAPIRFQDKVVASIGVILPSFRVNPEKAMTASKALPISVQKIENVLSTMDVDLHEVFSLNGFKNL